MKKKTVGAVESFTGGLFAATIINEPGASSYFRGSLVAYHNEIKELIGVDTANGVVTADVALMMALRGKEFLNVDYCFAFTGNAGPTASEDKPVGLVYIALNDQVYEFFWTHLSRNEIRQKAVDFALKKLKKIME